MNNFTDEEIRLIEDRYGDVDLYMKFWDRAGCGCATTRRFSELSQSVNRTWSDSAHTVYDDASASFAADMPDETPAAPHISDHYFTD